MVHKCMEYSLIRATAIYELKGNVKKWSWIMEVRGYVY